MNQHNGKRQNNVIKDIQDGFLEVVCHQAGTGPVSQPEELQNKLESARCQASFRRKADDG